MFSVPFFILTLSLSVLRLVVNCLMWEHWRKGGGVTWNMIVIQRRPGEILGNLLPPSFIIRFSIFLVVAGPTNCYVSSFCLYLWHVECGDYAGNVSWTFLTTNILFFASLDQWPVGLERCRHRLASCNYRLNNRPINQGNRFKNWIHNSMYPSTGARQNWL